MNNNIHNETREHKQSLRYKLSHFKAEAKQQEWLGVCKFLIQFLTSFMKSLILSDFKQTSCSTGLISYTETLFKGDWNTIQVFTSPLTF